MHPYRATQISEHVWWVGAVDWNMRDFHGYSTDRGTTYNAYLVMGEKITLIDTVKAPFCNELLSRVASVVDPSKISYIVSNHAEMDHSGSLGAVIDAVKPEKIFASQLGVKALAEHFQLSQPLTPVKDSEVLDLGNLKIAFAETRMLHWPDSMVSWLPGDDVLFSQDGFGMHLATSERFADQIDPSVLEFEGARYFANILLPFAPLVTRVIDRLPALGIAPKLIAPDHGPIWRQDLGRVLGWYGAWARQQKRRKALVVYDTMWNSTALMAHAIAAGLEAGGASVKLMSLKANHRSDIVHEVLDAGALLVGSPTLNNNLYPSLADFLTYLKGLKPQNLIGAAFGSYGWSGEAVGQVKEYLEAMKVELAHEGLRQKFVPDAKCLGECADLGRATAEKLIARVG
ncbi:MAG: FprA family A-type flavoprotein [Candidatus Methylomirabilia bacterium]